MERTEHSVLHYRTGFATIPVHFPNGQVQCNFCPSCNKNDKDAWKCMWLGGQCMSPVDGKNGILFNCPIEFDDKPIVLTEEQSAFLAEAIQKERNES